MIKSKAQHGQVPSQSASQRKARPGSESPGSAKIAQLEAMIEASPQMTGQRKFVEGIANSPRVTAQLQTLPAKPNHTGLPDHLKSGIENLSGMSMDHVKVHYNSSQPAQLNAKAYAQGADIHVAPGQEQHLPHEAWHVVQQAQGRVKPTLQMKNDVPVNDDKGLEQEADLMGGKAAAQFIHTSDISGFDYSSAQPTPANKVVQAYSIRREPRLGTLYSVSDNEEVVTGMGTPNHDLYVNSSAKIAGINAAAKQSMLDFKADSSSIRMFDHDYKKVKAGFKKAKFFTPPQVTNPSWLQQKMGLGNPKEHFVDLDAAYHKRLAPAILKQSSAKYGEALDKISKTSWSRNFSELKAILNRLVGGLELFKKLVIANQAHESYHDVVNSMDAPQRFIEILEHLVYANGTTKAELGTAADGLQHNAYLIRLGFRGDENVLESLDELLHLTGNLEVVMPEDMPVDLMLVHSVNYQESMMRSIQDKDPMFYRACDVMASTVMGNKVSEDNQDQLKIYAAGGNSGAFHYAAKILQSGSDWVTLESFAAGAREREILGVNATNASKNLDNSWQYIMYGSVSKPGSERSKEDNAFELYTKLRYFLKGIFQPGEFRTDQRDRLTGEIPEDAFVTIHGINAEKSTEIWQRLRSSGVFDESGRVTNANYLKPAYIQLRLKFEDHPFAQDISLRLEQLYHTPRSPMRHVQNTDNNEMKNIAGWIKLMGLPDTATQLAFDMGNQMAMGVDPLIVHNRAWISLMLSIEKNK